MIMRISYWRKDDEMKKRNLSNITRGILILDAILFFAGILIFLGLFVALKTKEAGLWPQKQQVADAGGENGPTPTSPPKANDRPEIVAMNRNATSLSIEWKSNGAALYYIEYRTLQGDWMRCQTKDTHMAITGLKANTDYEIRLEYTDGYEIKEYIESFVERTSGYGYGDPFCGVGANLYVGGEKRFVMMTKSTGCLGADVWPQMKATIYEDAALKQKAGDFGGGTHLTVTANLEGEYAYLRTDGFWSVYVSDQNGKQGWIQADALLIDLQDIFEASSNIYSIQYNRTNAYSSTFTIGGSVAGIDSTSAEESRYNSLKDRNSVFNTGGYNVIPGVTGQKLENYGEKTQMPVIWCLGIELIQCQKNALNNGCTLLIYDGYRPGATSKKVNSIVRAEGYLSKSVNGRNLANGFLGTNLSEGNYIANTSKHNKGIAVDLTLIKYDGVNSLGSEMRMQTKMHTLDFRSHMNYNNASADLLYTIMTRNTNLVCLKGKQEWWHYELTEDTSIFPLFKSYVFADYKL